MPRKLEHLLCTVEGCGRPHKAHGYCASHYQQFKRGEPIRPLQVRSYDNPTTCTVEGCDRPEKTKGYCNTHYMRIIRNGTLDLRRGGAK